MIRSMTAFASGERPTPWGLLGCELRSVNHRFLEVGVRLPDELRALEPQLRERVSARISRGKLDLVVRLRLPEGGASLAVNEVMVEQLGIDRPGEAVIPAVLEPCGKGLGANGFHDVDVELVVGGQPGPG